LKSLEVIKLNVENKIKELLVQNNILTGEEELLPVTEGNSGAYAFLVADFFVKYVALAEVDATVRKQFQNEVTFYKIGRRKNFDFIPEMVFQVSNVDEILLVLKKYSPVKRADWTTSLQQRAMEICAQIGRIDLEDFNGIFPMEDIGEIQTDEPYPLQISYENWLKIQKKFPEALDAHLLKEMFENFEALNAAEAKIPIPETLVHGDFHAENFLTDGENLLVCDWQSVGLGKGISDISFFISRGNDFGLTLDRENLVETYWKSLGTETDISAFYQSMATSEFSVAFRFWAEYLQTSDLSRILKVYQSMVDSYHVLANPYPNITQLIKQDLLTVSSKSIQNFRLIRAKSGVYVYNCLYDNIPAVVKYFENESDRREILNYQILVQHDIPTIQTFALGNAVLVMEDISISQDWRLGIEADLQDVAVAKSLAEWYFTFHENGFAVPELSNLYFEYDSLTKENLNLLIQKLPEAAELFQFLLTHHGKLGDLIQKPSFTLTYNDFYWTNFVVRKDKKAAMMFDYNLLGKGYRFSDFRNVCWSMSGDAKITFENEYNRLFFEKHGYNREASEKLEMRIDEVLAPIFSLFVAFIERESFPEWAEDAKNEALDGSLLVKAKQLLL